MPHSTRAATFSSFALAGVILGIAAWRLQFGVDVTDDSFYVALPVRFANGARPFLDEFNLAQVSALFATPFVKLWMLMRGIEGVVLFSRVLNLVVRVLAAGAVFVGARRVLSAPAALAASLLTLVFVPIHLANNSYNMLGMAGLTAGCFLGLGAQRKWQHVMSGVCHAIAAASYPPFALAVLVFVVLRHVRERRQLLLYLAGAAVPAAIVVAVMLPAGVDAVLRSVRYAATADPRGVSLAAGFTNAVISLLAASPRRVFVVLVVLAIALGARLPALRYAAVLVPLLAALTPYARFTSTHGTITWIGAMGTFALLPLWRDAGAQAVFRWTIVPGTIAGLLAATFSSNGYLNFAVGAAVAAQGALVLLLMLVRREGVAVLTAGLTAFVLVAQQFAPAAVYRDDDVALLDHRIRGGAFAGLRTTDQKAELLATMQDDLQRYGNASVLFYYDFPAGYLLAPQLTPRTTSVWTLSRIPLALAEPHPDVLVRISSMRHSATHTQLWDHLGVPDGYRADVVRKRYTIFVRR